MMEPLVLYHGSCMDGYTSAWIIHRDYPNAEFVPCYYGNPLPAIQPDRTVFFADFSAPRDVMERIASERDPLKFIVFDHHKTAQLDLYGLPGIVHFDMERSGAGITWDWFNPAVARPWLVNYVEDRDLWRFKLPMSQPVNAYVRSCEQTWENWDNLYELSLDEAAARGRGCQLHIEAYVRAAIINAYWATLDLRTDDPAAPSLRLPLVNVCYEGCSEVASAMLDKFDCDVAGYFFQRDTGIWQYGLRSRVADVGAIAKRYGGGGHAHAAGFEVWSLVHRKE